MLTYSSIVIAPEKFDYLHSPYGTEIDGQNLAFALRVEVPKMDLVISILVFFLLKTQRGLWNIPDVVENTKYRQTIILIRGRIANILRGPPRCVTAV